MQIRKQLLLKGAKIRGSIDTNLASTCAQERAASMSASPWIKSGGEAEEIPDHFAFLDPELQLMTCSGGI